MFKLLTQKCYYLTFICNTILLFILYWSKDKYQNDENTIIGGIYDCIIFFIIFTFILDIIVYYYFPPLSPTTDDIENNSIPEEFVCKKIKFYFKNEIWCYIYIIISRAFVIWLAYNGLNSKELIDPIKNQIFRLSILRFLLDPICRYFHKKYHNSV